MKVLTTTGLTELIQLSKNTFLDKNNTVEIDSVFAPVATSGQYSDLTGTPTVDQAYNASSTNAQSGTAVAGAISSKQNTITGAATTITSDNLTASKALISNASGKVDVSDTTTTELGYVHGVTSAIQTQLNNKQATVTGAATTITSDDLTSNKALISNANGKVAVSTVTSTELGYVSGVTSAIQTQLNSKVDANTAITGATKCKITYDSKGLVTAGADLASSDVTTALGYTPIQYAMVITDYTA